jgi:hypothetical protein
MGVISPVTLHNCSPARLLVGLLQEVTWSSLLKLEAILQCRLLKKGNNALPLRLLLGDKSVLQRGECNTPVSHRQATPTAGAERKWVCVTGFMGRISPMALACVDA